MITLDTSALVSLVDRRDRHHDACLDTLVRDGGPYYVSVTVLSEVAWFLEQRYPPGVSRAVLADIDEGRYTLDWNPRDLRRARELVGRYDDLSLGLADAAVVACAERHGGRVLTTDFRRFQVVARGEGTLTILTQAL